MKNKARPSRAPIQPKTSPGKRGPVFNPNSKESLHGSSGVKNRQGGASTKIMRKAGFSGKLHRGHVVDGATDFATSCAIKAECGACKYVNTNYGESLRSKFEAGVKTLQEAGVIKNSQILDPMPSPTPLGYRSYFKLAIRPASVSQVAAAAREGKTRRFAIGLFEPGTHKVSIDLTHCPVHTKPLTNLLADLQTEIEASVLTPFDEASKSGDLRYVAARSAHLTGEIMLTFVVTNPQKFELIRLVNRLRRLGHKINSAHMNINNSSGNAIFGDETMLLAGTPGLRERVCDLDIEISPLAFFQVNPWQANILYRRVEIHAGRARPGETAWDLYTGTGQIALMLARSGFKTLGIEEIEAAASDAALNAQRNKLSDKAQFIASRVEDSESRLPAWAKDPKVIVVNPSRRGLHETARAHITHILRSNPSAKLIYVSCEVQTLARDLKALSAAGHTVRQVEAFDMFAQTDKLEWLAVLTA
jgi:23S rRNA (uracil1939-C5)-methyltransferase